ncbi:F0F1 ATP synthase subunit B [Helicobacter winghamensis]|uniref:ATP synthase subunit b n=1 Tax=Helicobacter winghamensis TaxID=157268 RepID=A0A2N3PL29_9HELI|nr:F0F1 ATP synthase subunit B [Helicobacter winghamensis]EEO26645.1 ATP synthase F0, B subunit [Helicobacter winghamensis ATCC BAA-430]PKT79247.1 F0F1 ATP synthase subunit B [Helicobacter winghamensis]PKT79307.1 F0F1 ATP synthase subunit B [Helicobacter winghamensis]PKT79451.1 F0F1 ATP synthase subunit B [Helicobacter winghamensis]PKT82398.1 F0F1 ATP synthase subunit B [Helicobacter winghamensis]
MQNRKVYFLTLSFMPAMLFAAGGESANYDIIERTINFVIFFGLVYYFAADAIKNTFKARRDEIANSLAKIQEKLQESKKAKEKAQNQLEEAKRIAHDIVETAHKESVIITQKVEEAAKTEIESLVRQYNDHIAFEQRKAEKLIVDEILSEFLNKDSVALSKDVLAKSLLKKVA